MSDDAPKPAAPIDPNDRQALLAALTDADGSIDLGDGVRIQLSNIEELTPDAENANEGSPEGDRVLDTSIGALGLVRGAAADKDGRMIAGNGTLAAARRAGVQKAVQVVTRGDAFVVNRREDLDLTSRVDNRARAAALADNKIGQVRQNVNIVTVRQQVVTLGIVPATIGYRQAEIVPADPDAPGATDGGSEGGTVGKLNRIYIDCESEADQRRIYRQLQELGLDPQLSSL